MRIRLGGDREQADNRYSTAFWTLGGPTIPLSRAAEAALESAKLCNSEIIHKNVVGGVGYSGLLGRDVP
jgi:hypothetical protein